MALLDQRPPPLEDQIRQRWGQYGNWQHAGQDLVAQLAGLFRENGISDISDLQFRPRMANHRIVEQGESGPINEYDVQRQVYDAFLGDQQIGYLGDINRDGSYTRGGLEASTLGGMADMGRMGIDGSTLAWSAGVEGKDGAKGHLNFQIVPGPDGSGVVVPVWESSAAGDLENARMAATMAAMAAGGYYLGPEAAAGQTAAEGGAATTAAVTGAAPTAGGVNWGAVGTSAAKGAGSNMLLTAARGGDMNAILRSGLTGAVSGGMGGVGEGLGWSPTLTSAGTSAGLTLANGGTAGDALRSAGASGFSTYVNAEGITGDRTIDRAIAGGGSAAIRGGDARSIGTGALNGLASGGTQRGGNSYGAGDIDDALSEDNIVRFDEQQKGGNAMDDFDWDSYDWSGGGAIDWGGADGANFNGDGLDNSLWGFDDDLFTFDGVDFGGDITLGNTPVLEGEFGGTETNDNDNGDFTLGNTPVLEGEFGGAETNDNGDFNFAKWFGSFMRASGISGRDLLKLGAGGLSTIYSASQARQNARNTAANTEERDNRQNAFTTQRDATQNAFTTQRDATQNQYLSDRDNRQNAFTTQRDATQRGWNLADRQDAQDREDRLQREKWARMIPVDAAGWNLTRQPGLLGSTALTTQTGR